MCNSEQGEERKSYDAYAGEEEEEEQREKKLAGPRKQKRWGRTTNVSKSCKAV